MQNEQKNIQRHSTRNKVIASTLAGVALLGGTVAFALGGSAVAGAATTATSAVTQTVNPGGGGGRAWLKAHRKEIRAEAGKTVASTIGISTDELKQDLKNGQSVAEIATAHGVDPQTVATALVTKVDGAVDKAVTDGKLSQTRADTIKAKAPTVIDKAINHHRGDHQAAAAN
jgi:uncharacterized protein YidB (DUF937 family)